MRLLVIGGTRFVGRHVVEAALAAGHDVTLVHRSATTLFPSARHVLADRNDDLSALAAGEWDATVDVCAYLPAQVRSLAGTLGERGGHHVLVSSVSVYADLPGPGGDEDSALLPAAGDDVDDVTDTTYGPLKVACERAATATYGDRSGHRPPDLRGGPERPHGQVSLVGPAHGPRRAGPGPRRTGRPGPGRRCPRSGRLPARPGDRAGRRGVQCRPAHQPWSELLGATAAVAPAGTTLTWVDAAWLTEQGVTGADLPLWSEGVVDWASAMSPARAEVGGTAAPTAVRVRPGHRRLGHRRPPRGRRRAHRLPVRHSCWRAGGTRSTPEPRGQQARWMATRHLAAGRRAIHSRRSVLTRRSLRRRTSLGPPSSSASRD